MGHFKKRWGRQSTGSFLVGMTLLVVCLSVSTNAQTNGPVQPPAAQPTKDGEEPSIQDNSFLVEEAYNQEFGVVQHIQEVQKLFESKDWVYSFTEEWPVDLPLREQKSQTEKHQLSYTLTATSLGAFPGAGGGLGDLFLNYRYQLIGNGDTRVAMAPRLSFIAPTGDARFGRGFGGVGWQISLPLSVVANRKLVTHWNAGATFVPNAKNELGDKAPVYGYNFGQSLIYLVRPRFNLMLETVFNSTQAVLSPGQTQRAHTIYISPGFRWAYNLKNGTQIVPGVAVPVGLGPTRGEVGVLFYFSIEHPYRRLKHQH